MKKLVRHMALISSLAGMFGHGVAGAAETLTVGPFTLEAVERKIGAGGFPNTSGNPFKRAPVTTYRVLHKGTPVVPPGTTPDRSAPRPQWQWLDAQQGQPGPVTVVSIAHRPGPPRGLAGGGRWLSVYAQAVLDTQSLAIYRYTLNSTEVLNQLLRFYAAEKPLLAFSPGRTQFVVAGARDRPEELDLDKRFEHALIAFDFARQQGTVLPIDLAEWRLRSSADIDADFARRVVDWRQEADGREQAFLRRDVAVLR